MQLINHCLQKGAAFACWLQQGDIEVWSDDLPDKAGKAGTGADITNISQDMNIAKRQNAVKKVLFIDFLFLGNSSQIHLFIPAGKHLSIFMEHCHLFIV